MASSIPTLLRRSEEFFLKNIPVFTALPQDNRINLFHSRNRILEFAESTRPIVRDGLDSMMTNFIEYKRRWGSENEKERYGPMTWRTLTKRLLTERPLVFFNPSDDYMLKSGETGDGGFDAVENHYCERARGLLSYDEMALSALVSMSVPTYFINSGSRNNRGFRNPDTSQYTESGIYTACVGARFENEGVMEYSHVIVSETQNTVENGYGLLAPDNAKSSLLRLWANFYEEENGVFPIFSDVRQLEQSKSEMFHKKYSKVSIDYGYKEVYFDKDIYRKRMRMTVEPFLLDANDRARREGKKAHCFAVGLGLGVWKVCEDQMWILVDVYSDILNEIELPYIGEINFRYILAYALTIAVYTLTFM